VLAQFACSTIEFKRAEAETGAGNRSQHNGEEYMTAMRNAALCFCITRLADEAAIDRKLSAGRAPCPVILCVLSVDMEGE
jgi:hypothetical protein